MLVACLTSLVALNGKNHAGTGNSAAFTVTQPLERAQNDAFAPPSIFHVRRARMRVRSLVNPRGKTLTPVWAGPAARAIFFARRGVYAINGLNPRGAVTRFLDFITVFRARARRAGRDGFARWRALGNLRVGGAC